MQHSAHRHEQVDPSRRATTRRSLHGVAELVLAGPQFRLSDSIELRALPGGFGTVRPPHARVEDVDLVVGDVRVALAGQTLDELAAAVGLTASPLVDVYGDGPGLTGSDRIEVDPAAAAEIGAAFAAGEEAMRRLDSTKRPILWPEHFDIGIEVDRVNYGVSPGDASIDEPYAYVGPWDRSAVTGDFWNAPFGAARTLAELGGADEIEAFFREGQSLIGRDRVG